MKKMSNLFIVFAIILSDIMCAVVAYSYSNMLWGIRFAGYSAPAWVAFYYAIPYGIGIIVCIIVAIRLRKQEGMCIPKLPLEE